MLALHVSWLIAFIRTLITVHQCILTKQARRRLDTAEFLWPPDCTWSDCLLVVRSQPLISQYPMGYDGTGLSFQLSSSTLPLPLSKLREWVKDWAGLHPPLCSKVRQKSTSCSVLNARVVDDRHDSLDRLRWVVRALKVRGILLELHNHFLQLRLLLWGHCGEDKISKLALGTPSHRSSRAYRC